MQYVFIKDGFIEVPSLLNKKDCSRLYNSLKNRRNWGTKIFQSEKNYKKEFLNKPKTKLNPDCPALKIINVIGIDNHVNLLSVLFSK